MASSFVDTNVPIAYVFSIEPKNEIAKVILTEEYDYIYCSNNVLIEFNNRILEKKCNLLRFFLDLSLYLSRYNNRLVSLDLITDYAKNKQYSNNKEKNDVLGSIGLFWNYYCSSEIMPTSLLIEFVNLFLHELEYVVSDNINFCEEYLINIDDGLHQRINQYGGSEGLFERLNSCGMHEEDIEISLDAHDYNLTLNCELDFITFDKTCYKCVSQENLCFNKVKCYKDYE